MNFGGSLVRNADQEITDAVSGPGGTSKSWQVLSRATEAFSSTHEILANLCSVVRRATI